MPKFNLEKIIFYLLPIGWIVFLDKILSTDGKGKYFKRTIKELEK